MSKKPNRALFAKCLEFVRNQAEGEDWPEDVIMEDARRLMGFVSRRIEEDRLDRHH